MGKKWWKRELEKQTKQLKLSIKKDPDFSRIRLSDQSNFNPYEQVRN